MAIDEHRRNEGCVIVAADAFEHDSLKLVCGFEYAHLLNGPLGRDHAFHPFELVYHGLRRRDGIRLRRSQGRGIHHLDVGGEACQLVSHLVLKAFHHTHGHNHHGHAHGNADGGYADGQRTGSASAVVAGIFIKSAGDEIGKAQTDECYDVEKTDIKAATGTLPWRHGGTLMQGYG